MDMCGVFFTPVLVLLTLDLTLGCRKPLALNVMCWYWVFFRPEAALFVACGFLILNRTVKTAFHLQLHSWGLTERIAAIWNACEISPWSLWEVHCELLDPNPTNFVELASFLRIPDQDLPGLIEDINKASMLTKSCTLAAMWVGLACLSNPGIATLIIALILLNNFMTDTQQKETRVLGTQTHLGMQEGIYLVKRRFGSMDVSRGRGICWKGVFHTPVHVAGTNGLLICGGRTIAPSYCSLQQDLVCWGGMPQMETPRDGEIIMIKTIEETLETVCTRSVYNAGLEYTGFYLTMKTKPGLSGSPVFSIREDQSAALVALVGTNLSRRVPGRGIWAQPGVQVEICRPFDSTDDPGLTPIIPGLTYQIFKPPGSGKTRNLIPAKIREALTLDMAIIISPPTRAICQEISLRIEELMGLKPLELFRNGSRFGRENRIKIMPHAVLATSLVNGKAVPRKPTLFIMDEVHSHDAKSQLALRMLRLMCNADGGEPKSHHTLIELTATGFDLRNSTPVTMMDKESVRDHKFDGSRTGFNRLLEKLSVEAVGKKVVVFLPTVGSRKSGWQSMASVGQTVKSFGSDMVAYHRRTAMMNHQRARAPPSPDRTMFVLTTNMSEVGVNLDADICIDLQMQTIFAGSGTAVFKRKMVDISMAQLVQRRGRVGRGKPGTYYYAKTMMPLVIEKIPGTVEDFDLVSACQTLGLREVRGGEDLEMAPRALKLTRGQLLGWLEDTTINGTTAAFVKYAELGGLRTQSDADAVIRTWLAAGGEPVLVGNRVVHLNHYDDRDAKFLNRIIQRVTRTPGNIVVDLEESSDGMEDPKAKTAMKCSYENGSRIVEADHSNWNANEKHSHTCELCGHKFTHEHQVVPAMQHPLECPCCFVPERGGEVGLYAAMMKAIGFG